MLINNNRVVANSGDRVVVDRGNGDLAIWKDDNAILRAPGVVETTQRYRRRVHPDRAGSPRRQRRSSPCAMRRVACCGATGCVNGQYACRSSTIRGGYDPVAVSQLPRPRVQDTALCRRYRSATLIRALLDDAEQPDLGRTLQPGAGARYPPGARPCAGTDGRSDHLCQRVQRDPPRRGRQACPLAAADARS